MNFYAHSGSDSAGKPDLRLFQSLAEHLRCVAFGAKERAALTGLVGLTNMAFSAGLLHDLGKYRPEFQLYLQGLRHKKGDPLTRHKEAGAAAAFEARLIPVAFAILGHHGGIPDSADAVMAMNGPNGKPIVAAVQAAAAIDCPELTFAFPAPPALGKGFAADLFTRVLLSCLVDADWANTGEHDRTVKNFRPSRQHHTLTRTNG